MLRGGFCAGEERKEQLIVSAGSFPDWDRTTFTFTCPKCSERTRKTLRWIKNNGHFQCPGCMSLVPVVERENILGVFKMIDSFGSTNGSED
jgi:hypothetical protein